MHVMIEASQELEPVSVVCAGRQEYQQQVPRDQSLLHNLMAARRKDTNQPLSDAQICAQAFTFILAGGFVLHTDLSQPLYTGTSGLQARLVEFAA